MRAALRGLVIAAVLSVAACASWAAYPPATGEPYQATRVARSKRIAVVWPSRWDALNQNNVNSNKRNLRINMGTTLDMAREQGCDVHHYSTNFFESDADHKEMWTDIGSYYGLVIVVVPFAPNSASFARYTCADSTNGQLVCIGGGDESAATTWNEPSIRGFADSSAYGLGSVNTNGACLITHDGRDTLYAIRWASGARKGTLLSGDSIVVRVLRPFTTAGGPFAFTAATSDSNYYRPVGSWRTGWTAGNATAALQATAADSIAGPGEFLGPMWYVVSALRSGENRTGWINTLGVANSPRSVYWLKFTNAVNTSRPYPQLLWSLICRFTTAAPIRYAYDIDDMVDKGTNNLTGVRGNNSLMASALSSLAPYGVFVTGAVVNPDHAASYIRGENPRYEVSWGATTPHTYLRDLGYWIHHAHDSTAAHISSNLIGRYGGYPSGNNAQITENANVHEYATRRYASRWNPSAADGGLKWGIVQRLQWSDSVRNVVAPGMKVPPYLNFPANAMVPHNWRAHSIASNPTWTSRLTTSTEACPLDSLLWAYDYALNPGNTNGREYIYLRSGYLGVSSWRTTYIGYDNDTTMAETMFALPNERRTERVNGRYVQAVNVNSALYGAFSRSGYQDATNIRLANMLGLKNTLPTGEQWDQLLGESFNNDMQLINSAGTAPVRDHTARQSTRILYQHSFPGDTSTQGDYLYDVDQFRITIATQLRAMDYIAGRSTTRCVRAWEVHGKP